MYKSEMTSEAQVRRSCRDQAETTCKEGRQYMGGGGEVEREGAKVGEESRRKLRKTSDLRLTQSPQQSCPMTWSPGLQADNPVPSALYYRIW